MSEFLATTRLNSILRLTALTLIASLLGAHSVPVQAASGSQCVSLFSGQTAAPKSIAYYLRQVREEQMTPPTPRFVEPKEEIEIAQRWQGTRDVPEAIRDTLLSSTSLLNFQLLAADAGAVKGAQPGNLTSFRLKHEWRGKNMSTNVGIPIDAIIARSLRGESKLVPGNARAVFMFMHGGGTKTTGHHVAAGLSNFLAPLGIVVLSIDAPYHAYGPRVKDLSPLEFYEYLRDFRHEFIPEGVPTFIGGHSMGGLHADNLMRLSDRSDLGLHKAFAGLVNLSTPMDSAPGRSLREKAKADELISENKELMELVPEAERDLTVLLLTQGKSSALGGVSAEFLSSFMNWEKPAHGGKEYLPTLAIMGARDGLMVGRENIWKEYIEDLSNVEAHVMGQREDFKGRDIWVGHMIFDHHRPGTDRGETFTLIKEFIEKQLPDSVTPEKGQSHPLYDGYNLSQIGIISRVAQEYYINLAFRKFAEQHEILFKSATEQMIKIGDQSSEAIKHSKVLTKELKTLEKTGTKEEIEAKREELQATNDLVIELRELQQSMFVPKDRGPEIEEWARGNVERRIVINAAVKENNGVKKTINAELNQLRSQLERKQKVVDQWIDRVVEFTGFETVAEARERVDKEDPLDQQAFEYVQNFPAATEKAKNDYLKAFEDMVALQVVMNEANSAFVMRSVENGEYKVDPPPELIQTYKELDAAYAHYNHQLGEFRKSVSRDFAQGMAGKEIAQSFIDLWGSPQAFLAQKAEPKSLQAEVERVSAEAERLELESSALTSEGNQLLMEYINRIAPEYYTAETSTIAKELNRPFQELVGNTSRIEKLWKDWVEIWKERPPEQGTSLY